VFYKNMKGEAARTLAAGALEDPRPTRTTGMVDDIQEVQN
jgi:hypothetical protein